MFFSKAVSYTHLIKHLIPEGGYIDETRSDKNSYTLRAQINFNRTFDEKHEVSAIAGGERRAVHSTSTYVEKYGYDKVSLAHKYLDEATLNPVSYTHLHFKVKNVKSCRIKKEMSDYAFTFV